MVDDKLKIGSPCISGQLVSGILGQSSKATVFTTEDNHLRWQYHLNNGDIPEELIPSVSAFDSLMLEIQQYVPHKQKKQIYTALGKALFAALNSSTENLKFNHYEDIPIALQI